jgi:hypothetical protein
VISGVGPYDAPGATQGMRWQNRVGFQLGARFPPLARLVMVSMERQVRWRPERTLEALARAMSAADAEIAPDHMSEIVQVFRSQRIEA